MTARFGVMPHFPREREGDETTLRYSQSDTAAHGALNSINGLLIEFSDMERHDCNTPERQHLFLNILNKSLH